MKKEVMVSRLLLVDDPEVHGGSECRVDARLPSDALTAKLVAWADALPEDIPSATVSVRSGTLLSDLGRARAVLALIDGWRRDGRVPRVSEVCWEGGPAPTASTVGELVAQLLRLHLADHEPTLALPQDAVCPWVRAAAEIFRGVPVDPTRVEALRTVWSGLPTDAPDALEAERLLRLLADAARLAALRVVCSLPRPLREAGDTRSVPRAAALAGPASVWQPLLVRWEHAEHPEMFLVPTWQCELRCIYCTIPKQDGREMAPATAERAVELLLSTQAAEVRLHFFGGEPLANWPLVRHAVAYGARRARELGRRMTFRITTNGWSATPDILDWLADHEVSFQLSIDGDARTQHLQRPPRKGLDGDSYALSPAGRAAEFLARGFRIDAIMVVSDRTVDRLVDNFLHLADLGFERIQLNYAMGRLWTDEAIALFGRQLVRLGLELQRRWREGSCRARLVNLEESLREVRTNDHVTVDWDGRLYGSTSFLYTPALAAGNLVGHLDENLPYDAYAFGAFDKDHVTRFSFREKVVDNNVKVGRALNASVRWMRDQGWTGPELRDPG